jgi:arylformamidase
LNDPTMGLPPELHTDAALRERAYSPSSCIGGDYRPFVATYRQRSEEARARAAALGGRWQRVACGPLASQAIELCLPPAGGPPAALLVFIHGGYWQELSAADSLFAAAACLERGHAFAALDYTLAPRASVADIVAECRLALGWLHAHAETLGLDRARLVVAGSSAGAHLAAMVSGADAPWRPRAALLVSGVYWLEPLVGTSINDALGLDAEAAARVSPGRLPLAGFADASVCWGAVETDAFKAQSRCFGRALRAAGARCDEFEVPGRNHFDVILDLADEGTALGAAAQRALAGVP